MLTVLALVLAAPTFAGPRVQTQYCPTGTVAFDGACRDAGSFESMTHSKWTFAGVSGATRRGADEYVTVYERRPGLTRAVVLSASQASIRRRGGYGVVARTVTGAFLTADGGTRYTLKSDLLDSSGAERVQEASLTLHESGGNVYVDGATMCRLGQCDSAPTSALGLVGTDFVFDLIDTDFIFELTDDEELLDSRLMPIEDIFTFGLVDTDFVFGLIDTDFIFELTGDRALTSVITVPEGVDM